MIRAVGLIVSAGLAAPVVTTAQPEPDVLAPEAALRLAEISDIRALEGPGSAALIEPLTFLSHYYHDSGNYPLAAAAIEQTLGLIRANFGLSSTAQMELLRLSIRNESARGNVAGAWDVEQDLLRLARDHPTELGTVAVLREIADRRLGFMERYLAGEHVPEVQLGCYYKAEGHHLGSCIAGSKNDAAASILLDASGIYRDAADVIVRQNVYPSPELTELQLGLARGFYLHGRPRSAASAYELGRASLQRLYDYEVAHSGTLVSRARALIRMADWDLVYVRQAQALDVYARVLDLLEREGATREEIGRFFAPETPVLVPTFVDSPLRARSQRSSAGYVEIAFEITKFGRSRNVEVLDFSEPVSESQAAELAKSIRLGRFRPRIDASGTLDDTTVRLRYQVDE